MAEPILIIDPGHGGTDPGGGTNDLWTEKDFVLDISMYQFERFQALGVSVALTRSEDVTLPPSVRAQLVRESGASYCLSNHINAGGGDGSEIIHSIYSDGKLANAIAEALRAEGQNIRRVFTRTLSGDPRKDYYFMHRETGAVGTLIVEYGFADSKGDDVQQLLGHWKKYAEAVVRAFCHYIGHPYTPPGTPGKELPEVQREIGVWINGEPTMNGYVIHNVSYVPVRFIAEQFGASVDWDGQRVLIRTE